MHDQDEVSPGRVLAGGRYRIEGELGHGGMGTVYLARDGILRRLVALKIMRSGFLTNPNALARFRREARTASQVQHPNVVAIFDFGKAEDGRLYLAMEYARGQTLSEVIRDSGPLPLGRALRILAQIASALHAAHSARVVHRDLKPGNIVLVEGGDQVKVLDFGLAKMLGPLATVGLTADGQVIGTPEYIAPERCLDRPGDQRSDLYGLGIIAFELLVGRPPFSGRVIELLRAHIEQQPPLPSEAAARNDIPPALDAMILRLLAKRPRDRPHDAGEVLALLEDLLLDGPRLTVRHPNRPNAPRSSQSGGDTLAPEASVPSVPASTLAPLPAAVSRLALAWTLRMRGLGSVPLSRGAAALARAVSQLVETQLALDQLPAGRAERRDQLENAWLAALAVVEARATALQRLLDRPELGPAKEAIERDPALRALLGSVE